MRRRSEGEPTGDVGMPARRIERSFVSAGDEGEPGLTGRCSGAGAAVLMISSELPEVIGMANRIGVMWQGRLMGILDNRDRSVTQDQIMHLAVGGDAADQSARRVTVDA